MSSTEPAILRQIHPIGEVTFFTQPFYTIDDLLKAPSGRALSEPAPSADNAFADALGSEAIGIGYMREGAVPSVRVVTLPEGTTITPDVNIADVFFHRNTQAIGTLTVAKPLGNPKDGQKFIFKILSSAVQTFSWNAIYRGSATLALPATTTGASDYDYIGFIFNSFDNSWDLLALIKGV